MHPLIKYSPQLIVYIVGGSVAVWFLLLPLFEGSEHQSTLSEWEARSAAKRAYYVSDPTVGLATCNALSYDRDTDVWDIECTMDRGEGEVEVTGWRVTPDAEAHPAGP